MPKNELNTNPFLDSKTIWAEKEARRAGIQPMSAKSDKVEMALAPANQNGSREARAPSANECSNQERPAAAARGIVKAVLILTPFWALVAFVFWLLI